MNYEMKHYIVGPIATNCYFMCNMDTKEMILVDPGDQAEVLKERMHARSHSFDPRPYGSCARRQ